MSEGVQDQVIGKLVRQRRTAQTRLDTLRRAGKDHGTKLRQISKYLDASIQRVWFQRDEEDAPPLSQIIKVKMSDVNGEGLANLTDEIRATQAEADRLNEECKGAGY